MNLFETIFEIEFVPYFIQYSKNNQKKIIFLNNNKLSTYIISKKRKKFLEIIKNIFKYIINITKITFNGKIIKVEAKIEKDTYTISSKIKNNILNDAQKHVESYFGSIKNNIIGNNGPDTWMEGNILILDENEFNTCYYELGVTFKKISIKKYI